MVLFLSWSWSSKACFEFPHQPDGEKIVFGCIAVDEFRQNFKVTLKRIDGMSNFIALFLSDSETYQTIPFMMDGRREWLFGIACLDPLLLYVHRAWIK